MQQIQFFIIDQAYTTQKHRIQPLVASVFHLELSCSDSSLNVCGSFIHLMIYKICCNLKYTKKCELESLLLGKTKWNWISVSYIGSLQYCAHWHSEAIHRFLHYLTIPACTCKSIFFFTLYGWVLQLSVLKEICTDAFHHLIKINRVIHSILS